MVKDAGTPSIEQSANQLPANKIEASSSLLAAYGVGLDTTPHVSLPACKVAILPPCRRLQSDLFEEYIYANGTDSIDPRYVWNFVGFVSFFCDNDRGII